MSAVTRKHVAYRILGDLLVTLVAILTVYAYLHLVLEPRLIAAAPEKLSHWQQAEVAVSFSLLLVWIALEAGFFFLFLRSHFTRILAAVAFANCTLFFLAADREWPVGLLDRMAISLGGGSPEASLDILLFGPLILLAVIKGVCYTAALHRLPAKRVLLAALYANIVPYVLLIGLDWLVIVSSGG